MTGIAGIVCMAALTLLVATMLSIPAGAQESTVIPPRDVLGLAHINMRVTDVPSSVDFYTRLLGFTVDFRMAPPRQFFILSNGSCTLEITAASEGEAKRGAGIIDHIALEVDDIDAVIARLRASGVAIDGEPFTVPALMNGIRGIFFNGPAGERIELFQYLNVFRAGHGRLTISDNRRFLVWEDGVPFFYLADTAWELFHRLNREEAVMYLENRRRKGFTVIQAVALAELDGLRDPNAYGDLPLADADPLKPAVTPGASPWSNAEYDYWDHVDYIIDTAAAKGLVIGLLPTWGDKVLPKWGVGPQVFTPENARAYGRWIAERYKDKGNIIWILGGDRAPVDGGDDYRPVWNAMAEGIRSADTVHLMTYHTMGGTRTTQWFADSDWLDFHTFQSSHGAKNTANDRMIDADYAVTPVKPCMDSEPCYEDHPVNWKPELGWFDEADVRQAAYWAVFAGAHGHTYGCHPIWQFMAEGRKPIGSARHNWYDVLDLPGAFQMGHLRRLIESRPMTVRVPDQTLLASPVETGTSRLRATRGEDYAFIYTNDGASFTAAMGKISGGTVTARWFDPRTGAVSAIGDIPNTGTRSFDPPGQPGRGNDWVLVLDDASKGHRAP